MTRAEEAAMKAYPDNEVLFFAQDDEGNNHPVTTFGREINGFIFGYEQAEKDIASIIADLFEYPCNYSPIDEEMVLTGNCEDLCSSDEETAAKCWQRYFNLKRKK